MAAAKKDSPVFSYAFTAFCSCAAAADWTQDNFVYIKGFTHSTLQENGVINNPLQCLSGCAKFYANPMTLSSRLQSPILWR